MIIDRVHTAEIQAEIKDLKEKVRIAEELLNDDKLVAKLESEANWFRSENDRLKNQSERMNHDFQALMERMDTLHDQKKFLTEQLKAVMKKTRVYEANMDHQSSSDKKSNTYLDQSSNSLCSSSMSTASSPIKSARSVSVSL